MFFSYTFFGCVIIIVAGLIIVFCIVIILDIDYIWPNFFRTIWSLLNVYEKNGVQKSSRRNSSKPSQKQLDLAISTVLEKQK